MTYRFGKQGREELEDQKHRDKQEVREERNGREDCERAIRWRFREFEIFYSKKSASELGEQKGLAQASKENAENIVWKCLEDVGWKFDRRLFVTLKYFETNATFESP